MVVVKVDQVRRHTAAGVSVILAADDPSRVHPISSWGSIQWVLEVIFVDCEDAAAEAGHGLEFVGQSQAPGLAVMAGSAEASLPGPAGAGQAVDALEEGEPADDRHGWEGGLSSSALVLEQ